MPRSIFLACTTNCTYSLYMQIAQTQKVRKAMTLTIRLTTAQEKRLREAVRLSGSINRTDLILRLVDGYLADRGAL